MSENLEGLLIEWVLLLNIQHGPTKDNYFRATDLAAPMVVTACSSEEELQALAMRLAAKVLLLGTGWTATALSGKFGCHIDATR